MSKKKIIALTMSALLAVGVIGGSLAYFTSQDTAQNEFATTGDKDNGGSDIKVVEQFDPPTNVEPGTTTQKLVQVKNIDKYDQLIKVHFEVKLLDADANGNVNTYKIVEENGVKKKVETTINSEMVKNNLISKLNDSVLTDLPSAPCANWYSTNAANPLDSTYYYLGKVSYASDDNNKIYTTPVLESVQLNPEAGIEYKGIRYEIDVIADGVQASNDGFVSAFPVDMDVASENSLYKVLNAAQGAENFGQLKDTRITNQN